MRSFYSVLRLSRRRRIERAIRNLPKIHNLAAHGLAGRAFMVLADLVHNSRLDSNTNSSSYDCAQSWLD
jgi:hypothetical protein